MFSAHPRSRGEHVVVLAEHHAAVGSSPLARGTLCLMLNMMILMRLIPARAGNINVERTPGKVKPAHPRSRGEHTC